MAKTNYILSAFADEASPVFSEQIDALREAGIDRIEIRGVDGTNISQLTDAQVKDVKVRLQDAGISLSAIGSPFGKIALKDDFKAHLENLKRTMDHAAELGASVIRMFSFFNSPEGYKANRNQVIDQIGMMLDAADAQGMILAHENEKGIYGDEPERCLELIKTFGGKLKCAFDPANFIQCGVKPAEAYALLKEHIFYFHIKDALLADGSVVPAGMGDGSIPEILKDFGGSETLLTIEPHLAVFEGLAGLQHEEVKHKFVYDSNLSAFRAAVSAIKDVLSQDGYKETEANRWTL